MSPRPRRAVAALLAVPLLGGALLTACGGIPADDSPSLVASEAVPAELSEVTTTTTTPATNGGPLATFYVVYVTTDGEERLPVCFKRIAPVDDLESEAASVLRELIDLVPAEVPECPSSYTNFVPPELELLSTQLVEGGTLVVNLGNLGEVSTGQAQRRAIAQIVFTATELPGITGVRFQRDGEDTAVVVGEGRSVNAGQTVSRADFRELDPAPTTPVTTAPVPAPDPTATPDPASAPPP